MVDKIIRFCEEQHIFHEGEGVLLGLSGGADSVCLLHLLVELRERLHLQLFALHVHHGIRGEAADRDAMFSRQL